MLKLEISSLKKMRYNAARNSENEGEKEGESFRNFLLDPRKVQYLMSSYNCHSALTLASSSSTTSATATPATSHLSHLASPSWLCSALELSVRGHSAINLELNSYKKMKNIVDDNENCDGYAGKNPNLELYDFIKVYENPSVIDGRFCPVGMMSPAMELPTHYPTHAGKARYALKSVIEPYIATRRKMHGRVLNSNLTTELLTKKKIPWQKKIPDLFNCKNILKLFQRFVSNIFEFFVIKIIILISKFCILNTFVIGVLFFVF